LYTPILQFFLARSALVKTVQSVEQTNDRKFQKFCSKSVQGQPANKPWRLKDRTLYPSAAAYVHAGVARVVAALSVLLRVGGPVATAA
jgi:hypothetical protein